MAVNRLRTRPAAPAAAGVAVTFVVGAYLSWYRFMAPFLLPIDDEGYALTMVREWVDRGHLYDSVFSQYGPVTVLWAGLPARLLGVDLGYGTARLLNLALCSGAALLVAAVAWRLTRNPWSTVAAQAAAIALLSACAESAFHPAALGLTLTVAVLATLVVLRPRHPRRADVVLGVLLAALALTKINVGALVLVGVAWALVVHLRTGRTGLDRGLRTAADVGLVAVGPLVLLTQLPAIRDIDRISADPRTSAATVAQWAALQVAAALALVVVSRTEPVDGEVAPRSLLRIGGAAAGTALAVVAVTLATGTSVGGLVDGVLVRPLGQGKALTILARMSPVLFAWLAAPVALGLFARWLIRGGATTRRLAASSAARLVGAALLLASSLGAVYSRSLSAGWDLLAPQRLLWPVAYLPLVALVALPRAGGGLERRFERHVLAAVAVVHTLQAFPVAGIQMFLALVPHTLAAVVIASDGIAEGARAVQGRGERLPRLAPLAGSLLLAGPILLGLLQVGGPWIDRYRASAPMPGPGPRLGARVHPDGGQVLDWFAASSRGCAEVVSDPGLNWSYLITGRRPPTGYNATLWASLLDDDEEQAIVDRLRAADGPVCLLTTPAVLTGLARSNGPPPAGPLTRYLAQGFELRTRHGGTELWERRDP